MTLPQIITDNQAHLAKQVIPIMPFLQSKASYTNDRVLSNRLALMSGKKALMSGKKALVPNTGDWNTKLKTVGPALVDEPVDGRRLLSDDEVPE